MNKIGEILLSIALACLSIMCLSISIWAWDGMKSKDMKQTIQKMKIGMNQTQQRINNFVQELRKLDIEKLDNYLDKILTQSNQK